MVTGSSITWTRQMPHCSFTWQPTTPYKSCTSLARLNLRAVSVPVIQQRVLLYHSRVQEPPATSFTSFPNQPWSHGAQVEGEDEMKIYPSCIITWNITDLECLGLACPAFARDRFRPSFLTTFTISGYPWPLKSYSLNLDKHSRPGTMLCQISSKTRTKHADAAQLSRYV